MLDAKYHKPPPFTTAVNSGPSKSFPSNSIKNKEASYEIDIYVYDTDAMMNICPNWSQGN